MIPDRIIKKIPGQPPPHVREKQGYIEDVNFLTRPELLELIERQDKVISNKAFISKLPDKGARIIEFRKKLLDNLKERDKEKEDNTCGLLSKMSLTAEELEWQKGKKQEKKVEVSASLDSDDESEDETNPLRIMANHAGTTLYKKKHRFEKPAETLIKPEDVEDDELADGYVKVLCDKLEKPGSLKKQEKFLPNRTLRKSLDVVTLPNKPHWEVTAATPPPPVHDEAKMVSLQESFELQKQQASKLKEVQLRHATERLKALASLRMQGALPESALQGAYRDQQHSDSSSSSEDERAGEDEEEDDGEPRERDVALIYSVIDA